MTRTQVLLQLDRIPKIQMITGPQKNDLARYLERECANDDARIRVFVDFAADVEWSEPPCLASFRNLATQLFHTEAISTGCEKCDYLGFAILAGPEGNTYATRCKCRGVEKPRGNGRFSVKELVDRKAIAGGPQ